MHVGSDPCGRIHSVVMTDASINDKVVMENCLHGEEQAIYGDKAYANAARLEAAQSRGIAWRVNRNGRKSYCADRSFNRKSNRIRARVEHVFVVIKHLWRYRKVRYRGLAKNAAQVFSLVMLANFIWSGGSWWRVPPGCFGLMGK